MSGRSSSRSSKKHSKRSSRSKSASKSRSASKSKSRSASKSKSKSRSRSARLLAYLKANKGKVALGALGAVGTLGLGVQGYRNKEKVKPMYSGLKNRFMLSRFGKRFQGKGMYANPAGPEEYREASIDY